MSKSLEQFLSWKEFEMQVLRALGWENSYVRMLVKFAGEFRETVKDFGTNEG